MIANGLKLKIAACLTLAALAVGAPVAYATGNGDHKVTLCHNGHTITVDKHAAKAHFAHGDHKGECAEPDPEPTTQEPTEDPEPTTDPEPTEEPEPTDEPTTQEPTEEPTSTPTNTEQPSEPSEKPEPSPTASEPSRSKPNKTETPRRSGTSSKPSGHAGSSKKSAPQNVTVDRNADGVQDVYGPNVVEEGF